MTPNISIPPQIIPLDGPDWRIATDPLNQGCDEKWFDLDEVPVQSLGSAELSECWTVFELAEKTDREPSAGQLLEIPKSLTVGGVATRPHEFCVESGRLDLRVLLGWVAAGKIAYVYIPVNVREDGIHALGLGADWWHKAWIDGEVISDTLATGNGKQPIEATDHQSRVRLKKGNHLLVVKFINGAAGAVLAVAGSSYFQALAGEGVRPTQVPGQIQDVFPGFAGVAWYWRDLEIPAHPHEGGRYLLRFWDVDYVADVWVNGTHIGRHEGAQAKFAFDATAAVIPGAKNRIAVRVLSVFFHPIEGFTRSQTPHGAFTSKNCGGILDSVELVVAPQVRVDDLFVRAEPKTGMIRIEAEVFSAAKDTLRGSLSFSVAPAAGGEAVAGIAGDQELKPGVNKVSAELRLANPRLWELNDPYLYRLTARLAAAGSKSVWETSSRFGFRDFRFEDGYFRLNGRRVFLRSAHTGADSPGRIRLPDDPDLLRRDLLALKMSGFNAVRFIGIQGFRLQLDMCDEIGLMVYEEHAAGWLFKDHPKMAEQMNRTLTGMLLRDRNHPSIVMWGLLNETPEGNVFRQAVASLPLVRRLDDSRLVILGSGRFDTIGNHLNGLQIWKPASGAAPCVAYNPKDYAMCAVALMPAKTIALIPGSNGEYSAVRWTAPADGAYAVSATFRGTGPFTTTDVHVLGDGKSLGNSSINQHGCGDRWAKTATVRLARGRTLDFVVGGRTPAGGTWHYRWDAITTLAIAVRSGDGKIYDAAREFSRSKNPSGVWSYGWLAAGATPEASTFQPYTTGEEEKHEVIGGVSNPGSDRWEDVLADTHYYPRVPHRELEIARLRTFAGNDKPQYLSEYGIGSALDYPRFLRQSEQAGIAHCPLPNDVRARLATFMEAWRRFGLDETFVSPEDYFRQCVAKMAGLRRLGINALRSNPRMVGYNMTGLSDPVGHGEGFITHFRELKPGATDALFDGFSPVRWCTFAEPVHVYRGGKVRLEAVLSNLDAAKPGRYPARIEVAGPANERVFRKSLTVTIPEAQDGREPAFVIPVFSEAVPIDGPTGKYRLLLTFEKGVAAGGGETEFYVSDPADMPPVHGEVAVWGDDPELLTWLTDHGVRARPYLSGRSDARQVILVSNAAGSEPSAEAWHDLVGRIAKGSTAVFLSLDVFKKGDRPLAWLPLANQGTMGLTSEYSHAWVYQKDEWAKKHPLFDGLPCGGLMDYTFYRELIPDHLYWGQETPAESVAGAIRTSMAGACHSELMLSVYNLGAGRFILNALRVREELGQDPTAERLLRNMLNYAGQDLGKPPAALSRTTTRC